MLVCSSMYLYVPVCTSTYRYIPAFTLISFSLMPWYPVSGYITVQGSTMKYPKVLYPWITTVQQGRRQYKALYLDVPPCTVVIQGYRTFGYFIVLPCTVMYPLTGNQGIDVSEVRVNAGMYQYVLFHTSSYWYILVHTKSLTCVLVHTSISCILQVYTSIY